MSLDPVTLSVLASALSGIAEEAGALLIRGAYSSNIKERRDCSAALFDAEGRMVAQAEHIPVHLGAMPEAVAAVIEREPEPGDVWILNDPYRGGTHLPDVTLVSPLDVDGDILGYAVTRAHHSDVGGMRPGSMPADSRDIWQEGIVIPPLRLDDDVLELILANVRTPDIRRGDLRAQTAANRLAGRRLEELVERRGRETIEQAFEEVIAYAERRTREALRDVPDGTYEAERALEGDGVSDDDVRIAVAVTVDGEELRIDFAGTDDQVAGNVNCPLSVTRSGCYFALRALLPSDVPANAGTYAALSIEAPEGSVVNAQSPAAVVAGNVETSQAIADAVLAALAQAVDLPAQGQGTMNNLIIGGARLDLLRDDRRRPGRERRRPGPVRRPRRDVEHAQHADRGARARVPDARRALRAARRLRRRRRASGRGRRRARGARARAGDAQPAHRPPPPRARGRERRRAGGVRGEPAQRRGAAAEGGARARRGRRRHRPHARRRRLREAG